MKENELEAVRLLGVYTARRFDIWVLAGNAKAAVRAHVMSELAGVRMPQSKSGVNALRDRFNALSATDGSCAAVQASNFVDWCKGIESAQGWADDPKYGRKG